MVTNRVFKVLATNGTAMTNLADATAGRYLIIKEDGSTVTATTALDRDEKVTLVVNAPNGAKIYSDRIRVGDITSYNAKAFVARAEQVVTVTPGTPTEGIEYTVAIVNKADKEILQMRQDKRTYTVKAATGETATTLVGKFIAAINADPASAVVASGTATLILTAKSVADTADLVASYPNQIVFEVFLRAVNPVSIWSQATGFGSQVTVAPNFGAGNFSQINTLEREQLGYTGVTNRTKFPREGGAITTVAGTNYDVAVLEVDNRHDTNSVTDGEVRSPQSLIVAAQAGASAGLFAILARLASPGDVAATV
jgi:hypothetical protein